MSLKPLAICLAATMLLLSNLSIGMSTLIFDTSGTLLSVQPIKRKITIKKKEVSIFIAMINERCYCMLRTKIMERKF